MGQYSRFAHFRITRHCRDPEGTLWIIDGGRQLLRFDPTNLTVRVWPGIFNARRVVMDATVVPRALYVSMGTNGLAVIRAK